MRILWRTVLEWWVKEPRISIGSHSSKALKTEAVLTSCLTWSLATLLIILQTEEEWLPTQRRKEIRPTLRCIENLPWVTTADISLPVKTKKESTWAKITYQKGCRWQKNDLMKSTWTYLFVRVSITRLSKNIPQKAGKRFTRKRIW